MRKWICFSASLMLLCATGFAQGPQNADEDDRASVRIEALSKHLAFREDDARDTKRYYDELPVVTEQLQAEVDTFVGRAVHANAQSAQVQARLRRVLSRHVPEPTYGDLLFAKTADLRFGRSLVIVYTVVRPPHHDLATIRAYKADGDMFRLIATTAQEFEGYNMFKAELRSPLPDELWLLAWGQAHTANGNVKRFRLYAFDGESFKTIWRPEDIWNATVRLTPRGFAIDRALTYAPYRASDEYTVTLNGPIKTN